VDLQTLPKGPVLEEVVKEKEVNNLEWETDIGECVCEALDHVGLQNLSSASPKRRPSLWRNFVGISGLLQ
jgi:hypothetical protein